MGKTKTCVLQDARFTMDRGHSTIASNEMSDEEPALAQR